MRPLLIAVLLASPATAAHYWYETQYYWTPPFWGPFDPVPTLPLDVTFGIGTRIGEPDPPPISTFTITKQTADNQEWTITAANAADFGMDWSAWEYGLIDLPGPQISFDVAGRFAGHDFYWALKTLDQVSVRIHSLQQPVSLVRIDIYGERDDTPPPQGPEPSTLVLLLLVGLHWSVSRGNTARR